MLRVLAVIGVCACGRVDFEVRPAADAAGDATPRFCSTQAVTFCSDFDGAGLGEWGSMFESMGALQLDAAETHSAPSALRVDSAAVAAGQNPSVYVSTLSLADTMGASMSFWFYIDVAGTGDAVVSQMSFDDGPEIHDFQLVVRTPPNLAYVEDANTPNGMASSFQSYGLGTSLPAGTWHQAVITYEAGASANLDVIIDGATLLSRTPVFTTGGRIQVKVGIVYIAGPTTPWQVHFDDVTALVL